jgi:hypothetical protein
MAPHLQLVSVLLVLLIAACVGAFAMRKVNRSRRRRASTGKTTVNIIDFQS